MKLLELEVKNYGPHSHKCVNFSPRLNLIAGVNGSGKSSLLNALQFALSGETPGRTKVETINFEAEADCESYAKLKLTHGGIDAVILRHLQPAGHTIEFTTVDNDTQSKFGFTDVNTWIFQWLNIDKERLGAYIFVNQGEMDALIMYTPERRTAALSKLFGTTGTELVWTELGSMLAEYQLPPIGSIADAETNLQEARQRLTTVQQVVTNTQTLYDTLMCKNETYKQLLVDVAAFDAQMIRFNDARNTFMRESQALAAIKYDATLVERIERSEIEAAEAAKDAKIATTYLQQWAVYDVWQKQIAVITAARRSVSRLFAERMQMPQKPPTLSEAEYTLHNTLITDINKTFDTVTRLKQDQLLNICQACKRPFDAESCAENAKQLHEAEKRLATYNEQVAPLASKLDAINAWLPMRRQITHARENTKRQIKTDIALIHSRGEPVEEPIMTRKACEATIHASNNWQQICKRLQIELAAQTNTRDAATARVAMAQQALTKEQKALDAIPTHDGLLLDEAEQIMKECEICAQTLQQAKIDAALAEANVLHCEKALETTKQQQQLYDCKLRTRQYLEQLRELFHRNQLPKMVASAYLADLTDSINDTLGVFQTSFRIQPGDDLRFTAVNTNTGRRVPDKLLSTGQRVVLSWAFRIALNARFASSLGLLVLDEPTAFLDQHHRDCLPDAIERLRELCDDRDLQVLFVTHDRQLQPFFDNTILL